MRGCNCNKGKTLPAQICPTVQGVNEINCDYNVPVIHPSHTTNVVNHRYNFYHSYPHTESTVNRVFNQNFVQGPGPGQVQGQNQGFNGGPGGPLVQGIQQNRPPCGY
ncbi:spore coat protein [Paenalkalicoccus suaedae]|uniref:Spore coat protein n=1 Tax=Paenalkalicoccus suaedae TaxID=2592382 RepID=A0A859FGF0_9BACI|nr:CotD family spore coat protein [Paenalkalicoccus suaedae]QKS71306.1 spore coat protein [Paenalkalicoccus suaedae]